MVVSVPQLIQTLGFVELGGSPVVSVYSAASVVLVHFDPFSGIPYLCTVGDTAITCQALCVNILR